MSVLSETPSVSHHHSFAAAHTYVSWSESRSRSVSFRIAHCYSGKGLLIIEKSKRANIVNWIRYVRWILIGLEKLANSNNKPRKNPLVNLLSFERDKTTDGKTLFSGFHEKSRVSVCTNKEEGLGETNCMFSPYPVKGVKYWTYSSSSTTPLR